MSSPTFAINLFKLPYLAYKCVLQNMGNDVFELMKSSQKANSYVRMAKISLRTLIIEVKLEGIKFALETNSDEIFEIKILERSWDQMDNPVETFFNGIPVYVAYKGTEIYTCTSKKYKGRMASYHIFMNWIEDMFNINTHEFSSTCIRGNGFLKKCLSNPQFNLTKINFSSDPSNSENTYIHAKVLKEVMKRDQVESLIVNASIAENFQFSGPIQTKKVLKIIFGRWVTLDHLKSLKSESITLYNCNLTDDELNIYLKSILSGEVTLKDCFLRTGPGKTWTDGLVLKGIIPNIVLGTSTYHIPYPGGQKEPLKVSIQQEQSYYSKFGKVVIQASS